MYLVWVLRNTGDVEILATVAGLDAARRLARIAKRIDATVKCAWAEVAHEGNV